MKITVIGWYGTETIGDRAILAGLFSFFQQHIVNFEISIGSLCPFFTDRTVSEDYSFWNKIFKKKVEINIFDSTKPSELDRHIRKSDLVVMGGGPLMHIDPLFMIEYAFKKAKKDYKKTALLGCGVGPLFTKTHQKSVLQILKNSDMTILRDEQSKGNLLKILSQFGFSLPGEIQTSLDLSVEACLQYEKNKEKGGLAYASRPEYIVINLRKFPIEYAREKKENINSALQRLVGDIAQQYKDKEVRLVPMSYFHVGGDDRIFLNEISQNLKLKNITVQNHSLSVVETMSFYDDAMLNVGMRFHAVVLQTIISGRNYVFDYTEPCEGKIYGFIKDIDYNNFYQNRYIFLQEEERKYNFIYNSAERFLIDSVFVDTKLNEYSEIKKLL